MTTTPTLGLSYIAAAQAQKEITHNEALNDLDFLVKTSAVSTTLATPPSSPNTGDAYIIAASPAGAWSGCANHVACYYSGWSIKAPRTGWTAWAQDLNRLVYYTGSAWATLATPQIDATLTWAPGTLAAGAATTSQAVTVAGAALGDFVLVAAPYSLQGVQATAFVTAANAVAISLANPTGGAVTLASGAWRVRVVKA